MYGNPLDFNNDGNVSFNEALVGGLVVGGMGYITSEADAEMREHKLREEHGKELNAERARSRKLEKELADLKYQYLIYGEEPDDEDDWDDEDSDWGDDERDGEQDDWGDDLYDDDDEWR